MMSLTFNRKIAIATFITALVTGCANQPAGPVATKDSPSPGGDRQWYEDLDIAADTSRVPGTTVQKTEAIVVRIDPLNEEISPQPPVTPPIQHNESQPRAGTAEQNNAGMVVNLDPNTGEILPQPPVAPPAQLGEKHWFQSASAPEAQAQEVFSPAPGGGVMVKLNRQFHQPLIATIDPTGKVHLQHGSANRASTATK